MDFEALKANMEDLLKEQLSRAETPRQKVDQTQHTSTQKQNTVLDLIKGMIPQGQCPDYVEKERDEEKAYNEFCGKIIQVALSNFPEEYHEEILKRYNETLEKK